MKARTLLCGLALCTLGAVAQTEVSPYVPGATVEGVTYYFPVQPLRLVVVAEKQVYTPGEFSKYADRYLRLSQINQGTLHEVEYKKYRYGTLRSTRSSKKFTAYSLKREP